MEEEAKKGIKKMVQAARNLLQQEILDQLEGVYGLRKDGTIEDIPQQIKDDFRALKAREGFEYFIDNERSQGVTEEDSVKTLVLNLSFTHLNRLIALKLMERRKVIRESISGKTNSNGFKFFMADFPEEEERWRCGQVDGAYRNFILHQYGTISEEIHVLFDPEDISNLVFPRPRALDELLDLINQDSLANIWEEDETIGWIYQYFTPKELREKARKESAAPRNSYELAFRNQFYTPKYVVKFLTDNTLGRTWYEMCRGDTKLADVCEYMVRRPNEVFLEEGEEPPETGGDTSKTPEELLKEPFYIPYRAKKDPREIRVLDPAVGSGHFLLYCFDLLQIIYEEAYDDPDIGHSLKKEYPSVEEYEKSIPGLILRCNLHGIDIDLRATQIASLALWLRAQRAYREIGLKADERPKITKSNIACAEPMPGDVNILEAFKKNLGDAVLGELVSDVWKEMKLAGEAGSLLKIEERIPEVVKEAKEEWLTRPTTAQLDLSGKKMISEQLRFDFSGIKDDMFWDEAEERLLEALERFAEEVSNGGAYSRRLFAEDAAQGFAFIDVMRKKYDVVLMNPPFGAASVGSKGYIDGSYPRTKNDLYATFVERMLEVLHEKGFIGIISSRTGFFLSSFTRWREEILMQESSLHTVADFGFGVLEAMVETAAYTIEKVPSTGRKAVFFRLLKEDVGGKGEALLEAIKDKDSGKRFVVKLDSFSLVPNSPFSYWVSDRLRYKFKEFPPFEGDGGAVQHGLSTKDDFRFMRLNWEVSPNKVLRTTLKEWTNLKERNYDNIRHYFVEKTFTGVKWVNLAKGGEYSPYYSDIHLVVNYQKEAEEIHEYLCQKYPYLNGNTSWILHPECFYFRAGLTWPLRTIKGYHPRAYQSGCVFGHKGPVIFPSNPLNCELGIQNSKFIQFCIELMTMLSWEVGYVRKLPFYYCTNPVIEGYAKSIYELKERMDSFDETTHIFYTPIFLFHQSYSFQEVGVSLGREKVANKEKIEYLQKQLDDIVYDLYDIHPDDRMMIEEELREKEKINGNKNNNLPDHTQNLLQYCIGAVFGRWDIRMALDPSLAPELADPFDPLPVCPPGMLVCPDGLPAGKGQIVSEEWLRSRENVLDIPENIPNPTSPDDEYPLKIDWDGILVDDPGHEDDIIRRVRDVLELIWKDEAPEIEKEACEILGVKSLRDYFRKKFFNFHTKRYSKSRRKAPIYWQLATRNKNYSLWLYYHRLTSDTLFLALSNYINPKVEYEETKFREMEDKLESEKESLPRSQITKLEKEIENKADFLLEIKEFRATLKKIAQSGYDPDFDDGVILNMAPLHELIPWNEPAKYWKELEAGKYDWAHIAMKYWQERVKEKCKKDKSLAIAHGLEELYDGNSN